MILLDPDLDQAPTLRSTAGKAVRAAKSPKFRLPAVSTMARFLARARKEVKLSGQVSVLLTTDEAQRRLNRRFRGKNKPTDVLSFPADQTVPGAEKIAGDLSISVPTARRQAEQQGHALSTELKVLILHGVLHLAGYDHETDTGQMARRERSLRARLGLPGGLIERAAETKPKAQSRARARRPAAAGPRQ